MSKQFIAWSLFLIQMGCATVFGLSQFSNMLSSTQGVSMSWFAAWEVFLLLNLWLAYRAHRVQASLITGQTLIMYAFYAVMIGLDLSVLFLRDSWAWSTQDSLTAGFVAVGSVSVLFFGKGRIGNPLVKGWLAVFFKAVPQLVLAWTIHEYGGKGLALSAIIAGHVTILCRLGQLTLAIKEAGRDKNRIGSFMSEMANELSWVVVTIVWA